MVTAGSSWNLHIREQFLVVTFRVRTLVAVAGVEDLRERFSVVTFHAWALVGGAGTWLYGSSF